MQISNTVGDNTRHNNSVVLNHFPCSQPFEISKQFALPLLQLLNLQKSNVQKTKPLSMCSTEHIAVAVQQFYIVNFPPLLFFDLMKTSLSHPELSGVIPVDGSDRTHLISVHCLNT